MNRTEHLKWAKERATEYARNGDAANAVSSMMSDLSKHPDFTGPAYSTLSLLGMMEIANGPQAVQRWIDGFN